jgi:hypothetical protein
VGGLLKDLVMGLANYTVTKALSALVRATLQSMDETKFEDERKIRSFEAQREGKDSETVFCLAQ